MTIRFRIMQQYMHITIPIHNLRMLTQSATVKDTLLNIYCEIFNYLVYFWLNSVIVKSVKRKQVNRKRLLKC